MRQFIAIIIIVFVTNCCYSVDDYYGLAVFPEVIELIAGENATIIPNAHGNSKPNLNWISSDPLVATVDYEGTVYSRKKGETTITASVNQELAESYIYVKDRSIFWLKGISNAYSDMTWVDNCLVGFSSSADDYSTAGLIEVKDYENGVDTEPTNTYRIYHKWGHCNTVDYSSETDCLIMGNGSSDYDLTGTIIVIPGFKSLITNKTQYSKPLSLQDVNALVIDCEEYRMGTKFNVVWGDEKGDNEDIAFLLTANLNGSRYFNGGDMSTIRKISLCKGDYTGKFGHLSKNDTPYNGTFNMIESYHQDTAGYKNCNQGTCYNKGELCVAVGHDGLWYWRMVLYEGKVFKKIYKSNEYTKASIDGNASGIAVKDGYMFIGCANKGIMAIQL